MKKYLGFILLFTLGMSAQTLTEAKNLFVNGKYEQALPAFQRELKRKPKDAGLNYWYGTCLYKTDQQAKSIPYLRLGEKGRIKEASYYLAEYAYQQMDYEACLKHLDIYIAYQTGKHTAEIAKMLKNAKKIEQMLQHVEAVVFIDSLIVHPNDLPPLLKLHPFNGNILKFNVNDSICRPDDYAYQSERKDRIYASDTLWGEGRDITLHTRLLDGWEQEPFPENINQSSNECNPYFLSDGITIYFASDGYGSIGGYDLFVSRYNSVTGTFLTPVPLPFPFNSIYNDYFYIIDEAVGRGYLVSDRCQKADSLIVYTFIPNKTSQILSDKSEKELKAFAQIHSIAATQKGINIDSIRQIQTSIYERGLLAQEEFHENDEKSSETKQDHVDFFIRDGLVYHHKSDFHSVEARTKYEQWLLVKKRYADVLSDLAQLRKEYGLLPEADEEKRKDIRDKVLRLEWTQLALEKDLNRKEMEIRRIEIESLNP